MAEQIVLYETDEKVSVITLNRPEKLNAISAELKPACSTPLPGPMRCGDQRRLAARRGPQLCAGYDIGAQAGRGRGRLARRPDQGA